MLDEGSYLYKIAEELCFDPTVARVSENYSSCVSSLIAIALPPDRCQTAQNGEGCQTGEASASASRSMRLCQAAQNGEGCNFFGEKWTKFAFGAED